MYANLQNLVRQEVTVPKNRPLLPVFEAVSNALDAIADRRGNGTVRVTIVRHPTQLDGTLGVPKDIIVEDDGIGFTDENLESFCELYSPRKLGVGGKGRGRLSYLRVFSQARIASRFATAGVGLRERKFDFNISFEGRKGVSEQPAQGAPGTRVILQDMEHKFADAVPKNYETLIRRFIWHFLPRILSSDGVEIVVIDGEQTKLVEHVKSHLRIDEKHEPFTVGSREFELTHLRFKPIAGVKHRLILAAAGREVDDGFHLGKAMPVLGSAPLRSPDQPDGFVYVALLQGRYLDEAVDPLRLGFAKDDDDFAGEEQPAPEESAFQPDLLGDPRSISLVRAEALKRVRKFLEPHLQEAVATRVAAIESYIRRDGMGYHFLRPEVPELARTIKGTDDTSIESALHRKAYEEKARRRDEAQKLLSATPKEKDEPAYFARWQTIVGSLSSVAKSELADYVAHRRAIIDLVDDQLGLTEEGTHRREEALHSVIFPKGTQSGQVSFEQQNLWLIDERLAFHEHLFSDKSVSKISKGGAAALQRPDLAIFASGFAAFHDGGAPPASLVLVELKRPARTDASHDDPVAATLDYVEKIKAGRAFSESGKVIDVQQNAFTTVYILADWTADFQKYLKRNDFKPMPGDFGQYRYHDNESIMFYALSFKRVIESAKLRNRVFFKKLGIE